MVDKNDLKAEIDRLSAQFADADPCKLAVMAGLVEQAAYERIYLRQLNEQAMESGLVKFHPDNASIQVTLPVSKAITQHSATLTNILDKLCRNLAVDADEDDDFLEEYN